MKILEDNGTIDVFKDRWAAFPVDPAKATDQESAVFQGLTTIFDAVTAAAKQIDSSLEQIFGLIVNGNVAMYSDRGATSSRPDGFNKLYMKLREAQEHPEKHNQTADIAMGRKPPNNVRHFDFAKLVYDMEQILALDPCRRFTFGTTVENRTTRLWFLSRATLLRTEPFDFIKERRQLVIIFLCLAFSSLDRMGWDPTIAFSHLDKDGRRQYHIKIENQSYMTVDVLSDSAADSPLGRATRVWKVKDSSDKIRVLKDVWLECDRLEEHKIREAILADAKALNEREEHTLSAIETQSVAMSMPTDQDAASQSDTAVGLDQHSHQETQRHHPRRTILESVSAQEQASSHPRYHYRIVFEQCATTIHDERSLANVFRAIVEVVKALYVLHSAGWVHRDLSGGNVYWFNDEDTGLIGDFEYATRMMDRGRHNVRTGTPFFMAAETLVNAYLFTSANRKLKDKSQISIDFDLVKKKNVSKTWVVAPAVPFAYNPLHDLESVWWIIVYVLFFNDDVSVSSSDPTHRQRKMQELFHGRLDVNDRQVFLRDFNRLPDAQCYLSPSFGPALAILTELADVLTTAYANSEKTYPTKIDDRSFIVHDDFLHPLLSEENIDSLANIKLVKVKENSKKRSTSEVERPTKRSR
ncbi:hypothetical protein F5890DRAFT_1409428 [Lentinula detonsa]|uniref:Protein kinase domain-containing protein n=1 Tax=Lentinula detonsa TaxID=2804962 RepID=A0AA38Q266_9AGAR|nr:hypothetical protein F5890DRAFT_1409428 [Lentinula detonsa]